MYKSISLGWFIRAYLYWYFLSIIFLSFYTDAKVPFFSAPNTAFFLLLVLSVALLFASSTQKMTNQLARLPLPVLIFYALLPFIFFIKFVSSINVNSIFVYGFTTTLIYYLSFSFFSYSGALSASIRFAKFVILASLLVSVYELYQLELLGAGHQELLNKTNQHYLTTKIHGSFLDFRPLGLTGNYSINSSIYVISMQYIIYCRSISKDATSKVSVFMYGLLMVTGIGLAQSGTGYFLLLVFLCANLFQNYSLKLFLIASVLAASMAVLIGEMFSVHRLEYNYFFHNLLIFNDFISQLLGFGVFDILFGSNSDRLYVGRIDTFITLIISEVGLIGALSFVLFFLSLFRIGTAHGKFLIFIVLLGSIRYPAMANQIVQVFIAFYLYLNSLKDSHKD